MRGNARACGHAGTGIGEARHARAVVVERWGKNLGCDVPGGVLSSEESLRDEVLLHGEHVEAGRALVQVAHIPEVPAVGGVRAPV